jgi:Spy/CpxP family protein refolding chaperone
MKKAMIWSMVGLVIVVAIAVACAVGVGHRGWRGHRWGHFGPAGYLSRELNLSNAQKEQIKTMWQVERPTVARLLREVAAEVGEMDLATAQGNPDDAKVQEIAERQGRSIARLVIEKERLKSKIYTSVLNPAQRQKADELQRRWHERLDRIADRLEK